MATTEDFSSRFDFDQAFFGDWQRDLTRKEKGCQRLPMPST